MRFLLSFFLIVYAFGALTGCNNPPTAPKDLESLLGFLFERMDDDDPEALTTGLENLYDWFQDDAQLGDAREGFLVKNLPASALAVLDDKERSASGLEGITVATKSPYCSRAIAGLLTWEDFGSILDNFTLYERTFRTDPTCFGERACTQVEADSHTRSAWAGLVEMESKYTIQFRWVETKYGWMMLQRFWLKDPVPGDSFDVRMNANYYIGIVMDDGGRAAKPISPAFRRAANGAVGQTGRDIDAQQEALSRAGSLRIHANWFNVDTGVIPIPDETIRSTLISNQINDSTRHDNWLGDNPEQFPCPQLMMSTDDDSVDQSDDRADP